MKRIKSMGLSICALLLAAAIFLGGAGTLAFAEEIFERAEPEFFSGQIVDEVELTQKFKVPSAGDNVDIIVKAPNGQPITPDSEGWVTAGQLGNYTIEIKDGILKRTTYTYNVYCSMTREYAVYVDYNGAKIPTYMAKGGTFEVPNVFLAYTDDDGELVPYDVPQDAEYDINGFNVTVTGADNEVKVVGTQKLTVTAKEHGTMILRYSINLAEGKYFTKEYKIFVQDGFKDESKPKMSIANVPTTANINTKVTLPIATATDDFDERVYVEVKVWHETLGDVVKVMNFDKDTGYALPNAETDTEKVAFDNVRTMSFYPTATGTYRVSYKAIDNAGNETIEHFFNIECTDGLAPVFVDFDRSIIPNRWGLEVIKNGADNKPVSLEDTSIILPIPNVKDNADSKDLLTITARIIDPDSRTVLRFTNILDAETNDGVKKGHIASNTLYDGGKEQAFDVEAGGLVFDFNKYEATERIGTYTVEYRVSDSKGKTRTYSPAIEIEVVNSFEDTEAPTIDPIDTIRYILLGDNGDKTLEIPKAVVSDNIDTNPQIEYTMTFTSASGEEGEAMKLDKADILDIVKGEGEDAGKYFLENDNDFHMEIGDGYLSLVCVAKDNAGNESKAQTAEIKVYLTSGKQQRVSLVENFNRSAENLNRITKDNKGTDIYKSEINLGDFRITGITEEEDGEDVYYPIDSKFVGFEVLLKNPKNDIVAVTLERMIVNNEIYVKNLSFNAKMTGWHDLYIRAFDITGESVVYLYSFEITGQLNNDNPYSIAPNRSAIIPTTNGSINTKYTLKNIPNENATGLLYILRASGNSFSLIGNDFIANTVGTYTFQDFVIAANEEKYNIENDYAYDVDADLGDPYATYSTTVNESEQPSIEILGDMPAYHAKETGLKIGDMYNPDKDIIAEGWVVLPSVSAFNRSTNAEVEIKVTDRDGANVNAYKVYENAEGDLRFFKEGEVEEDYYFANRWAFAPHSDGSHTVTYTATVNNINKATSTHTVLIGKIIAPIFTLNEYARKTYSIDSTFKFYTIKDVRDAEGITATQINRYTYTKKLIDPSGNTVVTITGNDQEKYGSMENNNGDDIILEKNGTYTEVYEVTDLYGNTSVIKREFQVASKSRGATSSMKMLSTILIIVAVLLLIGVVFYIIRFRTVKRIKK